MDEPRLTSEQLYALTDSNILQKYHAGTLKCAITDCTRLAAFLVIFAGERETVIGMIEEIGLRIDSIAKHGPVKKQVSAYSCGVCSIHIGLLPPPSREEVTGIVLHTPPGQRKLARALARWRIAHGRDKYH